MINEELKSSKYVLNQIVEMLGMLKKIYTAGVYKNLFSFWQSTGPIIGFHEPTPLQISQK